MFSRNAKTRRGNPYKPLLKLIIFETFSEKGLQNHQKSIRIFTINHMAFRRVEKPYKTLQKHGFWTAPGLPCRATLRGRAIEMMASKWCHHSSKWWHRNDAKWWHRNDAIEMMASKWWHHFENDGIEIRGHRNPMSRSPQSENRKNLIFLLIVDARLWTFTGN